MSILIIIILCAICCILSCVGGYYYYYITYLKDYTLYVSSQSIMASRIGGSPATQNVASVDDCRKLCESNSTCQTFNYNAIGKKCTVQSPPLVTGTLMGYKLGNNKFTVYDGYGVNDIFAPNLVDPIPSVAQEECQKQCTDNTGCYLYKYQYGPATTSTSSTEFIPKCYLKKLVGNELLTHGNLDRKSLEK